MKPLPLTLLAVVGLGLATMRGQRRDMADETAAGHRSRCSGQYDGHHPASRVRAAFGYSLARTSSWRTASAQAARSARRLSPMRSPTAIRSWPMARRSPSRPRSIPTQASIRRVTLRPVIPLGISPSVLVVPPERGWTTVGDLIAAAKAKPGALNFSSVGIGSATHLSAERFRRSAGVDAVHVPFKGGAEAMTEVMAGRIDFFFGPVGLVLPNIQDGKLRALVVNGAQRSSALPNVPTTLEAGIANAEYPIWFGLFLPAKTPREIVAKLHGETLKALQSPKVRERLAALGIDPMPMSPADFAIHVQREIASNADLVKAAGLQAR